jgi:hypothetical protein
MSNVGIKDASDVERKIDTFQRVDGSDTVEIQAVAIINPATGDAIAPGADGSLPVTMQGVATDATLTTIAGTAGTSPPTPAAGANGLLGWLRGIFDKIVGLDNKLPALVGGKVPVDVGGASLTLSGEVEVKNDTGSPIPTNVQSSVLPTGAATAAGQAAIISALGSPLQEGGTVALDGASLAALETINVGNLPADPATQTTLDAARALLASMLAAMPVSSADDPTEATAGIVVRTAPPLFWRVGFAEVGSGLQGLAAQELDLLKTGSGMAVSQSGGNLVITAGTTVNSETVIRSKLQFRGALLARYKAILSQRIVNQTFRFELADLIGDALAYAINSATSVTVTIPGGVFTAADVGKSLRLSALSSVGIPGRYVIASTSGNDVTFTVAGWPASGGGTLTVYGHNWMAAEYSGTTATAVNIDAQRRGWQSGATAAAINTTASPGHVGQFAFDVLTLGYSDALVTSNTGYQWSPRGSRVENIPDEGVPFYFLLVVQNGSTAPASTTTLTVGFLSVEDQPRNKVRISSSDPAASHALPVQVMGGTLGTQPVSIATNTPTLAAGTNRAGFVAGAGIWYDDSSTVLAANASFTGTSRDATVTATATAFANAATFAQEVRTSAESDQSGTLWLEVSRDNINWRRVKALPTASVTGGAQYAELVHRPSWRYWRTGFTNGATLQTRFSIGSLATGL